jgi:hypothetical protein
MHEIMGLSREMLGERNMAIMCHKSQVMNTLIISGFELHIFFFTISVFLDIHGPVFI